MDPISVTASAIAFATAVKDLVELGRKIHESFAKVSRNRRNAQRTADNIMDMIEEIGVFCENNKDTMANMKEFTVAMERLLEKLRDFETSILPLIPQRSGFWRSVSFLRGWWDNNKIEDRILDLERDIREARRRHMLRSAMRAEVKLEVVHQDTARGLADISYGLDIVRRDVSAIRVRTPATAIAPTTLDTSEEREQNVVLFVRSAMSKSASLLRPPDEVTEEVWTTVFIKSQVHYLEAQVAKVSTLRVFGQSGATSQSSAGQNAEPFSLCTPTFSLCTPTDDSTEISCLRRDVVRRLMDLRDLISNIEGLQAISVNEAAIQLNTMWWQLSILGLREESELFLAWAIKLARVLVNAPGLRGKPQHRASLALYLQHLSRCPTDMTRSQQALEESLSITEDLLSQDCTDTEIRGLHAAILIDYADYAPNNKDAIARCIQAIQLLEGIFDVQILAHVDSHGAAGAVMDPCYDLADHIFSLAPTPIMIERCSDAFFGLALYMLHAGKSDTAKCLAHLCIALRQQMVSVYGDAHQAAWTLSFICRGELAQCFTDIELLNMVDECALLFRQLMITQNNPVYSQGLMHTLWRKAEILGQLRRNSESIAVQEEAVRLAGQVMQDTKLQADALFRLAQGLRNANRCLDAARTMDCIPVMFWDEAHGSLFGYLSQDLLKLRHYKESAEAAKNSIAIYRERRVKHPDSPWRGGLIYALRVLAQSLISLGDQAQGLIALNESVSLANNALSAGLDIPADDLSDYLGAFQVHAAVKIFAMQDYHATIDYAPIQQLEILAARHPHNGPVFDRLTDIQTAYAYHLYRVGRLQDALQYINHCRDTQATRQSLTWIMARALDAHGDGDQALVSIQTLRLVSRPPWHEIVSMVQESQIQANLGNSQKAQEVADEALNISVSGSKSCPCDSIWASFGIACAALLCGDYARTIASAHDGIKASADLHWEAYEDEFSASVRPSFFAIMSSAQANTGNIARALDYARQAVVLSHDIAERKHKTSSLTAEQSLMETRGYLAEALLAAGDPIQARQICEERRSYFQKRIWTRMGENRDLAPILRMLGVLCCSEGRHEDGEEAAQELTRMIERLGIVFPSLLEQVKIRLRRQARVPILKVLDKMTAKLDCEHQKGITALFQD